ncbi:MAG: hypothetical protein ACI9F9_000373 [Candidatus Paceibacteria bacterium]|jgi:hypothetical protein
MKAPMDQEPESPLSQTRRQFFGNAALGLGKAALLSMLGPNALAGGSGILASAGAPTAALRRIAPKAKRAIYLFMAGAPSQIDMFDYKPKLNELFDADLPESIRKGQRLTTMTSGQERFPIAPSKFAFKKVDNGGDGAWISELLPKTAAIADKISIVKSVWTEAINHDPAITLICTGREFPGWPSLGAWLNYGLGSANSDLPTFVVLHSSWTGRQEAQALYNRLWGSGILPGHFQGVALRSSGDPVLFLKNAAGISAGARRRMLDRLAKMNARRQQETLDPEVATRIAQYEMAYRMQTSVPELTDLSDETEETFELYGPDSRKPGTFASHCLLARRLAERGVRFTQIFHRGWDQHFNLPTDLPNQCRDIDQPAAALVQDLERRGMLDETLVVWGGEFGRTAYCQGKLTRENYGRDHHPKCFTVWLAGGGIRPGTVYGETDDFSYNITEDPVHISDLNATILHCLGLDNQTLSVPYQGLDVRLTGVNDARILKELLT